MDTTKTITDILLYFIPAIIVLMGMFLVVKKSFDSQNIMMRKFIEKELHIRLMEDQNVRQKESMPLKLQAYERLVLFLERIGPNSILVRVHSGGMTAQQLQLDLISTIRAEFEHNLSQQIYISENAWEEVKDAKEEMIRIVNISFNNVGKNATGIQMSSNIIEQALLLEILPTQRAIDFLKMEAKKLIS